MKALFQSVVCVGTSAGLPTAERNVSCNAIKFDNGDIALVDCGEGTQQQFVRCPKKDLLKLSRVRAILITHMHGDHIYGLPGLCSTVQLTIGKCKEKNMLIVGPRGIKGYLTALVDFDSSQVDFVELEPEQDASGPLFGGATWHAFPVVHSPEVHAYSYVISEPQKEPTLDAARARAMGVSGKQLGVLKAGKDVTLDNGTVVRSADVLLPPPQPRRIVVMGDNHCVNERFVEAFTASARNCSVLVDECTFPDELEEKNEKHSSPSIVAKLAQSVNARTVVLTHFSQRIVRAPTMPNMYTPDHLVRQVHKYIAEHPCTHEKEDDKKDEEKKKEGADTTSEALAGMEVIAAEDFLEIAVPKMA